MVASFCGIRSGAKESHGLFLTPMSQRTIALVPLRGGSKGIPKKNIKAIAGRPLCAWVLRAASEARRIDAVYVSTDSDEIKEVVAGLGLDIQILDRPADLATDEATTESVMMHFLENVRDCRLLITIQATSPLLQAQQLDEALANFDSNEYDSMLSVVRTGRFFWTEDATPLNYDPQRRQRRQDFRGTFMENGAFYITKASLLAQRKCRLGGHIGLYEMPEETGIEIDTSEDWDAVARLLQQKYEGGLK